MTIRDKAYIVGAYEHPTRKAPDKSVAQLHAESAKGALEDAGLSLSDIDGYFCAGDAPGLGMLNMADYMGSINCAMWIRLKQVVALILFTFLTQRRPSPPENVILP